jgi:hypothetical protein
MTHPGTADARRLNLLRCCVSGDHRPDRAGKTPVSQLAERLMVNRLAYLFYCPAWISVRQTHAR